MVRRPNAEPAKASTPFDVVGRLVRTTFPTAVPFEAHGMPGWRIARRSRKLATEWGSTIDPRYLAVLVGARASGVSLHIWDPADYRFLAQHKSELEAAGFEVMQACVRWKRKGPLPEGSVEKLLTALRRSGDG